MNYLQWLGIFFGAPFFILLIINRRILFSHKGIILRTIIGSLIFSIPWNIISIKTGIWFFPKPMLGITILELPLEEYIFIIAATTILTYATLIALDKNAN